MSERIALSELGTLDRDAFVERVGFAFEDSPWVAAAAWERRPFDSLESLHAAMVLVVDEAARDRQLALVRAHPELAGRAADALTPASSSEQASAGLDRLAPEQRDRLARANAAYRERFGMPFVVCVREHTIDSLLANAEARLDSDAERELHVALGEIAKIAALRLGEAVDGGIEYEIGYGKAGVPVYRHYAAPLRGLPEVPESAFRGRDNAVFANEVTIEVLGGDFLPAYTRGDNSNVVATDSMKNIVLEEALAYEGATLEGFLDHLAGVFHAAYEQIGDLRLSGRELPFSAQPVPAAGGFEPSAVLRQRQWSDRSTAELRYRRDGEGRTIVEHRCGRERIQLLKTKGSAFTSFVRDEHTTLPERADRPLFLELDVHWRYAEPADAPGPDHSRYVAGEQVRDVCAVVFHELVSESIQQLLHEFGKRLLERYPQLRSVELVGRNMTRDPYATHDDPDDDRKVFVPPFPALGTISLKMTRSG